MEAIRVMLGIIFMMLFIVLFVGPMAYTFIVWEPITGNEDMRLVGLGFVSGILSFLLVKDL